MRARLLAAAAVSLAVLGTTTAAVSLTGAPTAQAVEPPDDTGFLAGANDFNCKPSAAHPRPVILVHGTFENMSDNWLAASPMLKAAGYCVFAFNYGGKKGDLIQGVGKIEDSAAQMSLFVDKVQSATGAAKVDVVGHSQGGMMPRYYMKFLGGAAKVDTLVGLASSNHGTSLNGLANLATQFQVVGNAVTQNCPACTDQITDSAFVQKLNAGDDGVLPNVKYTVIETNFDEVVTPFTSAFLKAAPNVTNITLQNVCPNKTLVEHVGIAFDTAALQLTMNALDPANPVPINCN